MRYFRIVLTPGDGAFHTLDALVANHAALQREAILHLNLLSDGTGVALYQLSGDAETFAALLDDEEDMLSYDIFDSGDDDTFYSHVHFHPDDPATTLLEIADENRLVIDPPLEFTEAGSLRLTAAGPQENVRKAAMEIPDSVDAHLELIGEFEPEREGLMTSLTERQQEVLRVAVEQGYYAIPRRATHEDLAADLDCSAGTVGEHLRKIEARILSQLVA